jgi:hypothetical protein
MHPVTDDAPCPKRPGGFAAQGGPHCWHETGTVLTTRPPQYEERCCWCGTERVRPEDAERGVRPHGPFRPPGP